MRRMGVWAAVTGAVLICVGGAFAARAGNPPAGAFSGQYKVTYRITNLKKRTPYHWIFRAQPACPGPCHRVKFRERFVPEKTWRKGVSAYTWNGKAYGTSKTLRKAADCVAKSGSTVKNGYDIVGHFTFKVRSVTDGRVTRWSGTGKDSYLPNAAGRAHHCKWGAYDYVWNAVAQ